MPRPVIGQVQLLLSCFRRNRNLSPNEPGRSRKEKDMSVRKQPHFTPEQKVAVVRRLPFLYLAGRIANPTYVNEVP